MIHRVILGPEAKQDILEIEAYLLDSGPEPVRRFRRVLAKTLRQLRENPRLFPLVWHDVRRAQTRPFKYGVFFVIDDGACSAFAIVDLRRDPETWKRRR